MQDSKSFTGKKLDWLDRVAADPKITNLAFRTAYALAQYVNERSGHAFPSYETLGSAIASSRRGAINAVALLKSRGHLRVTVHPGRTHTNHFEMVNNGSPFSVRKVNRETGNSEQIDTQNTLVNTTTADDEAIEILFSAGGVDIESDRQSIPVVRSWIDRARQHDGVAHAPIEFLRKVIGQCRTKWHDPRTIQTMRFYQGAVDDALNPRIR